MYQVIDGRLYCDGEPVGVRRQVVRRILDDWGYAEDTVPAIARGAVEEMLKIERELLVKGVEITLRDAPRFTAA